MPNKNHISAEHNGYSKPPKASETTPLLADDESSKLIPASSNGDVSREENSVKEDPENSDKIPKAQLAWLCYGRMMEAIAYFGIFPFINEMIWRCPGVEKTDTGFYSGLIESFFALTQMLSMQFWSRVARRYGRKPVVAGSLFGMGLATLLLGFSSRIWQMILIRCVAGFFSGSAVAMRLMFFEISTPKTEARIFSFFPLSNNFGMFFGPFIGGALTNPVEQYPSVFGNIQLFKDYPYALATIGCGGLIVSSSLTTWLFVEETTARHTAGKDVRNYTLPELLKSPGVFAALFIWFMTLVLALGYTAVLPTFWFNDVDKGGFHFSPFMISAFIAFAGVVQALWTVIAYPPLERRIGRVQLIRLCYSYWPSIFILAPVCNVLLRYDLKAAFWTVAPLGVVLGNSVSMAFSAVQILINDVAPSRAALETLNTIALSLLSIARAAAPAVFGTIYALGVSHQILWGELVWLVFILLWIPPITVLIFFPPKISMLND